jgi:hypothetical protein
VAADQPTLAPCIQELSRLLYVESGLSQGGSAAAGLRSGSPATISADLCPSSED